jgi:hypothetical protein
MDGIGPKAMGMAIERGQGQGHGAQSYDGYKRRTACSGKPEQAV